MESCFCKKISLPELRASLCRCSNYNLLPRLFQAKSGKNCNYINMMPLFSGIFLDFSIYFLPGLLYDIIEGGELF